MCAVLIKFLQKQRPWKSCEKSSHRFHGLERSAPTSPDRRQHPEVRKQTAENRRPAAYSDLDTRVRILVEHVDVPTTHAHHQNTAAVHGIPRSHVDGKSQADELHESVDVLHDNVPVRDFVLVARTHVVDGARTTELGIAHDTSRSVASARLADLSIRLVGSAHLDVRGHAHRTRGPHALRLRLRGEQQEQNDKKGKELVHDWCLHRRKKRVN
jgi:hypothetical protein